MSGRHIKVLGRGDRDLLSSLAEIDRFLVDLVARLEMRALGDPHLYEVVQEIAKMSVEPFEDEGGVTGVVVLSTSHCAIHTWPLRHHSLDNREMFVLDIYSCRDFVPGTVLELVRTRFGAYGLKVSDLSGSLAYP